MGKPLVLSGSSPRRKLIGASLALALTTALAISGGTFALAASSQPIAPAAPAYDGSAAGGKVIVVLKQQQMA